MRLHYLVTRLLPLALMMIVWRHAAAQTTYWAPLNGPYGSTTSAIIYTAAGTLLVGADVGVFRSELSGSLWERSDEGIADGVLGFAAHPGGNVVARTQRGSIYFSADDGHTWGPASIDRSRPYIISLAVAPDGTMYAGGLSGFIGFDSGIFRSTDGGASWNSLTLEGYNVSALCADTANTLLVGLDGSGDIAVPEMRRSTDGGVTWKQVLSPEQLASGGGIMSIVRDSSGNVWATQLSKIWRSTDRGINWDTIPSPFNYPVNGLLTFAVSYEGSLMAGTTAGPYRTRDNGATWQAPPDWPAGVQVNGFAFRAGRPGMFFAATTQGVMLSMDNNATWREANDGIPASIRALAASGDNRLIAVTSAGAQFSTDGGQTWRRRHITSNGGGPVSAAILPNGTFFIGTNLGQLHRSIDDGATWTVTFPSTSVYALGANSAGHLFMTTFERVIHRSTDNGDTWISAPVDMAGYEVKAFAFDSTRSGYAINDVGVLKTTDNGMNWLATSLTEAMLSVAVDHAGTAYVAGINNFYRSTDLGATWTKPAGDSKRWNALTVMADGSVLASGTSDGGVFRSTDMGATWNRVSDGLPDSVAAMLVTSDAGKTYAGMERNSIYRWTGASSSVPINPTQHHATLGVYSTADGASIEFLLPTRGDVVLSVSNSLGERIATIFSGETVAGSHTASWNATGVPSGMYFITLQSGGGQITRGVVVRR